MGEAFRTNENWRGTMPFPTGRGGARPYNMQDMLQFWGVYQTPDGRDDSPIHDPYHSRDDWN